MSDPDAVAALAAERVAELRHQIDYLASTVALLPASPRRAAAHAAVQAIERDIAELIRYLGVVEDPGSQHQPGRPNSAGAVADEMPETCRVPNRC
jgi:hypothetical protein